MIFSPDTISPRIGLGTAQLGLHGDRNSAYRLLDTFVDLGGTLIDTAAVYSEWVPGEARRSETIIGEWLKLRGARSRVRLSTKGGHPPVSDMTKSRLDSASLRSDVETSLRQLGTDHIDLYLLHRDDRAVPVADIFGTLGRFVDEGKIGATGCSNWDADRIAAARQLKGNIPVANQLLGNILSNKMTAPADTTTRVLDGAAFRQAEADNLSLMLFSSQCQGALAKARDGKPVPANYANPASQKLITGLLAEADGLGVDANLLALAFLLHVSPVILPLVGPNTIAQVQQCMPMLAVELDAATVARLADLSGFAKFRADS